MGWFAEMWSFLQANYEESVHRNGDSRVQDWFLVYSPWPTICLCLGYLALCYVGPKVMAGRQALDLKPVLVVYNFFMVGLSYYIFMELFIVSRYLGYNYRCDLLEYKTDVIHMRLVAAIWMFYFSKLIEFLDTLFFILRKKNNQITFLHVYHHASMLFIWWIAVKWFAGGMAFFSPMLNCMVHVLMYAYYGLSVFPSLRKYLWWKRYITMIQLTQFLLVIVVCVYNLSTGCGYDKRVQWAAVIYLTTQFLLFVNFYIKSYTRPSTVKTHSSSGMSNGGLELATWSRGEPSYGGNEYGRDGIRPRSTSTVSS